MDGLPGFQGPQSVSPQVPSVVLDLVPGIVQKKVDLCVRVCGVCVYGWWGGDVGMVRISGHMCECD